MAAAELRRLVFRAAMRYKDLSHTEAIELIREPPEGFVVLDVRGAIEHTARRIPDSKSVPLQELVNRAGELDPEAPTLVYCEHGIRSVQAVVWLETQGFERLFNVRGGIAEWTGPVEGNAGG